MLSIVIITYNSDNYIYKCLDSLYLNIPNELKYEVTISQVRSCILNINSEMSKNVAGSIDQCF